jgi:hypothetical protein
VKQLIELFVGAYPRGTACALIGMLVVLCHYLRWRKRALRNPTLICLSHKYPASDSRFWTSRSYLLIGISLSVGFLILSVVVDGQQNHPDWQLHVLAACFAAGAVVILALGCIYLFRHWKEAIDDFREPASRNYFRELTQDPASSDRYALAPARIPLLKKSMWLACGVALFLFVMGKRGIPLERVLDNLFAATIFRHIFEVLILALLVVLWTTRNRIALFLRSVLLLLFSLILLPTLGLILFWLGSKLAPALVAFSAVTISLNVAFYYCIEKTHPSLPNTVTARRL